MRGGQGVSFYPLPSPTPLSPSSPLRKRKISSFSLLPFLSQFSPSPTSSSPPPSSPSSRTLTYPPPSSRPLISHLPLTLSAPSYMLLKYFFTCILFYFWWHKAEIIMDAYLCTCILHRKYYLRHLIILLSFVLMQQKKLCTGIIS